MLIIALKWKQISVLSVAVGEKVEKGNFF